jgi:FMN-dependent NADH-azoreductase
MNVLHIDSCALGDHSSSRQSTAAIASLIAANQQATVRYRDLAASPLSHASGPLLQALSERWNANIPMNAELRAEVLQSASLLQEFMEADVVLIGAPMHNFSVPSTLKAWLDRLLELRSTMDGKRLSAMRVLLATSGCTDVSTGAMLDLHETQLLAVFRSLGVGQVSVVHNSLSLDLQPAAGLETGFKAAA